MSSSLRNLERKADKLLQEAVRAVWKGVCSYHGIQEFGCAHHLIHRRFKAVRHNIINCPYVCHKVHRQIDSIPKANRIYMAHLQVKFPAIIKWYEENRNPPVVMNYETQLRRNICSLQQIIKDNS